MPQIIPTAEPFFFPAGKTGCLLIHGFTGAPKEMRWMGEYLARQGFSVLGVRLAGHATRPEDMIRARYTDWLLSVEGGYHLLRGMTDRVFLVGLSMGSILSLVTATRFPIAGVVAMSTPGALPPGRDLPVWLMKAISRIMPYMPKGRAAPDGGWFDKEAFEQHVAYPKNPVRCGAELKLLIAEMHAALPQVTVPVLLIHSRDDTYVPSEHMPRIYERLGTSDKTMLWVEGGGHVITEEPTREQVFRAAADFIRRVKI